MHRIFIAPHVHGRVGKNRKHASVARSFTVYENRSSENTESLEKEIPRSILSYRNEKKNRNSRGNGKITEKRNERVQQDA